MNEPEPGAIASRFSEPPVATEADAIVRELAEMDPCMAHYRGVYHCVFCESEMGPELRQFADAHLPTCLWLRARKMAGMG